MTDDSRAALHCQALEMPHLKCCVGSKLLSRWAKLEKTEGAARARSSGCAGKQNKTQLSKLTAK